MGNSGSAENDLENFGNQLGNSIIDAGHNIADAGSTAINETVNVVNTATTTITDAIVIPIVNEIDSSQVNTIREKNYKYCKILNVI